VRLGIDLAAQDALGADRPPASATCSRSSSRARWMSCSTSTRAAASTMRSASTRAAALASSTDLGGTLLARAATMARGLLLAFAQDVQSTRFGGLLELRGARVSAAERPSAMAF
jgi:hypothetical protein